MSDDLIFRRAAIDAIESCEPGEERFMITSLPPAQPDSKELSFTHKALDTISRQAAITAIQKAYADTEGGTDKCAVWKNVGLTNALHIMQDLPSAQPEQRWIPVTERLPKNREWVLGIFQEGDTGWINPIPFICDYVGNKTPITTQDNWLLKLVDEPHPYYENLHCIAWMPLPETWEEGEQG